MLPANWRGWPVGTSIRRKRVGQEKGPPIVSQDSASSRHLSRFSRAQPSTPNHPIALRALRVIAVNLDARIPPGLESPH